VRRAVSVRPPPRPPSRAAALRRVCDRRHAGASAMECTAVRRSEAAATCAMARRSPSKASARGSAWKLPPATNRPEAMSTTGFSLRAASSSSSSTRTRSTASRSAPCNCGALRKAMGSCTLTSRDGSCNALPARASRIAAAESTCPRPPRASAPSVPPSTTPSPITAAATSASTVRSAAPTEPRDGMNGTTSAFRMSVYACASTGRTPAPPRVKPISRAATTARASRSGSGSPTPPRWFAMVRRWKAATSSGSMAVSRPAPKRRFSPYTASPESIARSTTARAAARTARASAVSSTTAPSATATTSSGRGARSPIRTGSAAACCRVLQPGAGQAPVATGRAGSFDQAENDPGYSAGVGSPAASIARTVCAAVTPDPQ
jgi:hypothetical protein